VGSCAHTRGGQDTETRAARAEACKTFMAGLFHARALKLVCRGLAGERVFSSLDSPRERACAQAHVLASCTLAPCWLAHTRARARAHTHTHIDAHAHVHIHIKVYCRGKTSGPKRLDESRLTSACSCTHVRPLLSACSRTGSEGSTARDWCVCERAPRPPCVSLLVHAT
jgi:hypothetical protein